MRHLEAKSQLVETLQREISNAQETINSLTHQNTYLQTSLNQTQEGLNDTQSSNVHRVRLSVCYSGTVDAGSIQTV